MNPSDERHDQDDLTNLQPLVEAIRGEVPSDAQWNAARGRLLQRLSETDAIQVAGGSDAALRHHNGANWEGHRRSRLAWVWPCATAASLLVAIIFGVLWAKGGKPTIVERVIYVPLDSTPATLDQFSTERPLSPRADGWWDQIVLEKDLNALPKSNGPPVPDTRQIPKAATYRELLNRSFNYPET